MTDFPRTAVVSSTPLAAGSLANAPAGAGRLASLDALRGFDMFWIIGGAVLVRSAFKLIVQGLVAFKLMAAMDAEKAAAGLASQFQHPPWNGFTFFDLIFPLFLFLAGVAMPFSMAKQVERGVSKGQIYWRIARRSLLLVLFGMICNGMLLFDFAHLRYPSVLGRIGLAYGFAALIAMNASTRGRVAWIVVILLGYWAAMIWIPVPGHGEGNLEPGNTLADYIDRAILPGTLAEKVGDPEGLLSTVPAVATALLGVLAGQWLRRPTGNGHVKAAALSAAGVASLSLGWLWSLCFPLNKHLWTSSFVLWTAGWSLLLLAMFYLVIDVWNCRRWAFPFVVIGANAITIYMACRFIDFWAVGSLLFSRAPVNPAILPSAGVVLVEWCFVCVLYRKGVFLRL